MPKLCIVVKTPPILREFLISRNNGSDILKVDYNDVFARKIINSLETAPENLIDQKNSGDHVKIELSYFKTGNSMNSVEFKNYLSEESQNSIVYEWNNTFKEIFHNYVLGYCKGMKYKIPCQKMAILSFCDDYNIPMEKISFDTLKKSWDRSAQKNDNIMHFKRASYKNKSKN